MLWASSTTRVCTAAETLQVVLGGERAGSGSLAVWFWHRNCAVSLRVSDGQLHQTRRALRCLLWRLCALLGLCVRRAAQQRQAAGGAVPVQTPGARTSARDFLLALQLCLVLRAASCFAQVWQLLSAVRMPCAGLCTVRVSDFICGIAVRTAPNTSEPVVDPEESNESEVDPRLYLRPLFAYSVRAVTLQLFLRLRLTSGCAPCTGGAGDQGWYFGENPKEGREARIGDKQSYYWHIVRAPGHTRSDATSATQLTPALQRHSG